MNSRSVLVVQIFILILCVITVGLMASYFPYPSPLIKPWLSPKERWPTPQVAEWVESGQVDPSFLAFFYRDPERVVPEGRNIVAPADGKITEIIRLDQKYYVVIALTFWDVHVQRHPVPGRIIAVDYAGDTLMDGEGKDLVFLKEKNSPVQAVVTYDTEWGEIKVRLITSLLARRIEVWDEMGDTVEKGARMGRILLGSTVVIELPERLNLLVGLGETVVAGESILSDGWKDQ